MLKSKVHSVKNMPDLGLPSWGEVKANWKKYAAVFAAGFTIGSCTMGVFDAETVNPHMQPSKSPCTNPAFIDPDIMASNLSEFHYHLALMFAPYINFYSGEELTPENFGVTYQVTELVDGNYCEGVGQKHYDSENLRISISYFLAFLEDGGPEKVGLIFFDKYKISFSEGATDFLADIFSQLRERDGDIESFRVIIEVDPETGEIHIVEVAFKQHGNGFISVENEYLTCPGEGVKPEFEKSIGKNTIYPDEEVCEAADVGYIGADRDSRVVAGSSDNCEGDELVDIADFIEPSHDVDLGNPYDESELLEVFKGEDPTDSRFLGSRKPEHPLCEYSFPG